MEIVKLMKIFQMIKIICITIIIFLCIFGIKLIRDYIYPDDSKIRTFFIEDVNSNKCYSISEDKNDIDLKCIPCDSLKKLKFNKIKNVK